MVLLHDSEEIRNVDDNVFKADKYIMRTDVMFECKKFRNSDLRKKIYDMRQTAFQCQDEGRDTKAVELWEQIIVLEQELKELNSKSREDSVNDGGVPVRLEISEDPQESV